MFSQCRPRGLKRGLHLRDLSASQRGGRTDLLIRRLGAACQLNLAFPFVHSPREVRGTRAGGGTWGTAHGHTLECSSMFGTVNSALPHHCLHLLKAGTTHHTRVLFTTARPVHFVRTPWPMRWAPTLIHRDVAPDEAASQGRVCRRWIGRRRVRLSDVRAKAACFWSTTPVYAAVFAASGAT